MSEMFLDKLINKEFGDLTIDELKVIISNSVVFSLNKTDTKALERIVEKGSIETDKDKVVSILQEGLPSVFVLLSNLDKHAIKEGTIEISFRENLLDTLNKMNHLQLCVFIDKVLRVSKEEKIRFFRNKDYSLHAINSVISRSLGLSLVFEIFKPGKAKNFKAIDYTRIDKARMIEEINNQAVRYLYVLAIIAEVVLKTDEAKLSGTKINKVINEHISTYLEIIKKEKSAVRATGVAPKQTWTYTLCNITDITVEEDDEFFDEEDDDE